jgi:hypothetical protein
MEDLVSREIRGPEAQLLGVSPGWYVTKVSGTLMTEPFVSDEECQTEIKKFRARAIERTKADLPEAELP